MLPTLHLSVITALTENYTDYLKVNKRYFLVIFLRIIRYWKLNYTFPTYCRSKIKKSRYQLLQTIFNELIDSYLDTNVGISPAFITHSLSANLKLHLLSLFDSNQMIKAGIGINNSAQQDATFRSDQIHWLDRSHQNIYENEFLDIIDSFVLYLNTTCYTGITGYEFHYTLYEKGAYYKKHIDQFLHNKSRAFSMIIYLNEHWVLADGGELCIYLADYEQRISPTEGKSVFFKSSELAHEVLMTNKNRLSITGWFKTGE